MMKNPGSSNDKNNRELPFLKIIEMEINLNPDEVKEKKSKVAFALELLVALGCAVCFAPFRSRLFCLTGLMWILVHEAISCSFQLLDPGTDTGGTGEPGFGVLTPSAGSDNPFTTGPWADSNSRRLSLPVTHCQLQNRQ